MSRYIDLHLHELIKKTASAFMLKVVAALLMFVLNIVLARELGAKDVGVYFLGVTIVIILAVVGRVGMDNTLLKYVASYSSKNQYTVVKGVYVQGVRLVIVVSGLIAIALVVFGNWISINIFQSIELSNVIYVFAATIVPVSLVAIHSETLKGLKHVTKAISTQSLFVPLFALPVSLILMEYYGLFGAVFAYFISNILTLIVARNYWNKSIPDRKMLADIKTITMAQMMETSMPMYWVALFQIINVWFSTLALGAIGSSEDVGVFNIASRTALLTGFVLIAVNSIAAPKFAALFEQNDRAGLGITARHTAKLATIMAIPFLLIFMFFSKWVMGIFGAEFVSGSLVLIIIAIGQFVNVATGSVGYLLMMSGNEKVMRNILFICTVINISLNLILIPIYGAVGAAIATALVLAIQNIMAVWLAWIRLGILTIPIKISYVREE